MKIKIDREYTKEYQMDRVKEDIKEFTGRYTEGDVISAIRAQLDWWTGYTAKEAIIKFEVKAFPGGSYYNDETHFSFHIVIDNVEAMYRVNAYMNLDLDIPHPDLCTVKTYKLA